MSGEITLNRLDYGVGGPGIVLADDVTVSVARPVVEGTLELRGVSARAGLRATTPQ